MTDDPRRPDGPPDDEAATPDEVSPPREAKAAREQVPDMTRERARTERRDLD